MTIEAVLFDLDGTLVDTAPDLVAVLNRLLAEEGRRPMPYACARNVVSHGSGGLIRFAYGTGLADEELERLRQRFLELYAPLVCVGSRPFIELEQLINATSHYHCGWGIVTNKPDAFTRPLLVALGMQAAAGCVVSGDTLAQRKPHPAPLLHAARELGADAAHCVYVGDAERDIAAGRAASMQTIAATYGYIRPGENVDDWGADALLRHPGELHEVLERLATAR